MATEFEIVDELRRQVARYRSMRQWATTFGFSPTFISFVLNGKSRVTDRLATALGFVAQEKNWLPQTKE